MNGPKEIRTAGQFVSVAGARQKLLKISAGSTCVLEISLQPDADAHLQLFEGTSSLPMSILLFVQANELWSAPGKEIYDDLFVVCAEGGVGISFEVRSVATGSK